MLTFFTDTDCDFTPEEAKKYGCKLISMPFSIDGKTFYPYEDSETFDMKPFYEKLREGVIPTTGGVTEKKYDDYFRPEFEAGNDILYVHFSAAMTATFDSMKPAVDALLKEFPERKFYEIDTKGITIVSYNILCEIGDMLLAGKSAEEIVEWANVEVDKFSQYFFADDLKFFKRSGRVSGISATMGTLLGIRPIIYMTPDGRMESIGKERGRDKAMQRLVQYVDELGDNIADHRIIIGHTDAPEIADGLASMLRERFGDNLNIKIVCTNPTAGSHCGPNGAGISFHSKHR